MITREEIHIFRETLATGATISTLIKMNKDVLPKGRNILYRLFTIIVNLIS